MKNKNLNIIILVFLLLLAFLNTAAVYGQTTDSLSFDQYPFIRTDINRLENDSLTMEFFYKKLYALQDTKKGRVDIIHIGDSHIQADHFSGIIRQKLQQRFGNAGRGLIFPYRAAKSNEPVSYKTTTNTAWDYKRNVFYEKPLPIGVSGFTIETADSIAEINITVKDQPDLGYGFTKFTLFQEKGLRNYDITVCDEYNCQQGVFKSADTSASNFISSIKFEKPMHQIILRNKVTDTLHQKATRIYGMLLENDSSGVLYNMIGVNGAEYRHYSKSKYFLQQLAYLNADLVILSMGTNEGYGAGFDKVRFYQQIDSLVTSIKKACPNATLLLTTPGDSYKLYKKSRVKNPNIRDARTTIINYCLQHKLPYWDLYEIMGGYGSMGKWYLAKLSARDRVHFSAKGYLLQGNLFYQALMGSYERYVLKGN